MPGLTGHIEDSPTGLTHMQARYHDPVLARFMSNDPVSFSPERPDMFGRYTYAANDPVNMWDPDGEQTLTVYAREGVHIGPGGSMTVGRVFGRMETGGWSWTGRTVYSRAAGAGLGVDFSGNFSACLLCTVESSRGFSATGGGDAVFGLSASIPITDDWWYDLTHTSVGFGVGLSLGVSVETQETTMQDGEGNFLPWPSEEQSDEEQQLPEDVLWPSSVNGIKTDPGGWVDTSERTAWRPW